MDSCLLEQRDGLVNLMESDGEVGKKKGWEQFKNSQGSIYEEYLRFDHCKTTARR